MIDTDLKQVSLDYLMSTSLGNEIQSTLKMFEKAQETLYSLASMDDAAILPRLRVGTVLAFNVINRIANGKLPKDFTKEDWCAIANSVAVDAVNIDPQRYSTYVFQTYADYIDVSAEVIKTIASEGNVIKIKKLAAELRDKSDLLIEGSISESSYIEECLWISLEAMIKLLSTSVSNLTGDEIGRFINGVSSYAFEYGRIMLYKQEQEMITYYVEQQSKLDEELQQKYDLYIQELQTQSDRFTELVKEAFDSDFRKSLQGSVELARAVGVQDGIVETIEDVDDFFLN